MLPTTCSTVVRRVLAWVAVCCAIVALLPASIACWSASVALVEASRMPSWARESVSLIILVFEDVSSSNSLTRSRIGAVCRCTYFLRAKGLILPQKPSCVSGCKAGLPLAPEAAAAGWSCVVWERPAAPEREAPAHRPEAALQTYDSSFLRPPGGGASGLHSSKISKKYRRPEIA